MTVMLIVLNLVLCVTVMWSALCRLNAMSPSRTRLRYRTYYLAVLGGAAFAAVSPAILLQVPSLTQILIEALLIVVLYEASGGWHAGPPSHTRRDDAGLSR